MTAGLPAGQVTIRAPVLDEGHEGTDPARRGSGVLSAPGIPRSSRLLHGQTGLTSSASSRTWQRRNTYRWLNPPDSSFDMGTETGCLPK